MMSPPTRPVDHVPQSPPRGRRRRGFNLVEIMIAMFIMAIGMIMLAGALPVALRSTSDSSDLSMSGMIARHAVSLVNNTNGNIYFVGSTRSGGGAGDEVRWYSATDDTKAADGVAANPRPWFRNDYPAWGRAIPYNADERFAWQLFYRRRGAAAPYTWDIFIVVQVQRDGRFEPPVDFATVSSGTHTMISGDIYCDDQGVWRRYNRDAYGAASEYMWGVPGGIMVYTASMTF